MSSAASKVVPNWEEYDYGLHSLRIGRNNALIAAEQRPELINDITSHTSTQGRQSYSRAEVTMLVEASRKADAAVVRPVETAVNFGASDRGVVREPAYVSAGGDVIGQGGKRQRSEAFKEAAVQEVPAAAAALGTEAAPAGIYYSVFGRLAKGKGGV